ncbi:MAG: enoyl-CoA hydratase-related protein [bacterium]
MDYKNIIVEKENGVLIITLNRPPVNSLNGDIIVEFGQVLDEYEKDEELRAIIFTGAGEKAFCAGADLSAGFGGDPAAFIKRGQDTFTRIEQFHLPVIAAINGHALGGGCELALACHFRIMKEGGTIGLTESNLGIIPGYGGTQRLPRIIGRAKALDLMVFGKRIGADEALQCSLIHKISKSGETLNDAKEFAAALTKRAPVATKLIIDAVNRGLELPITDALTVERENFLKVMATADATEGITAFFEKREAKFKGK